MKCRRRPLHTWGVSAIAISHKAYMKAQELNEPLALMAKGLLSLIARMVSYILHCVQHFWLAIFFFVDDCILALESMIETVLPFSKHVFDMVDEAVGIIEALPGKFDDVLVEFSAIIKQVPFLDRGKVPTEFLKVGCKPEVKTNPNKTKLSKQSHNVSEMKSDHIETNNVGCVPEVGTDYNEAEFGYRADEKIQTPENEAEKKFGKMTNSTAAKARYKEVLKSRSKGSYKDVLRSKSKSKGTFRDVLKFKSKTKGTYKGALKSTGSYNDLIKSAGLYRDMLERGSRENIIEKKRLKKVGSQPVLML